MVPPVTLICDHCGCVGVDVVRQTKAAFCPLPHVVWMTQSDSALPILRYTTRCINRAPSESSLRATVGCGTMFGFPVDVAG